MKNMKRSTVAMIVLLGTLSVLSGCGRKKSSSEDPNANTVGFVNGATYVPSNPGNPSVGGGCVQINNPGAVVSFTVGGSAQIGVNGFSGTGQIGGYTPAGSRYLRGYWTQGGQLVSGNSVGDSIDLYLNGQVGQNGSFMAVVTLQSQTTQALYGACIQGVVFQNAGLAPGNPGVLYGSGMYPIINGQAVYQIPL
jgi:hypothetical protein